MKNITVSLDDETYRNARMKAAELDTSEQRARLTDAHFGLGHCPKRLRERSGTVA